MHQAKAAGLVATARTESTERTDCTENALIALTDFLAPHANLIAKQIERLLQQLPRLLFEPCPNIPVILVTVRVGASGKVSRILLFDQIC